jgi:hypothetical protein
MRSRIIVGGVLVFVLLTTSSFANMGPKWWGDPIAEPMGLKDVAITSEELRIDLRPLSDVQPVFVEAIYHLNNTSAAKNLRLLFVTGADRVSDFEVRLNDKLIESKQIPSDKSDAKLPESWRLPKRLPGFDLEYTYSVRTEHIVLGFTVDLPSGPSILRANYLARATGVDEESPKVTWQFPYILAPAREWKSLDSLDITVYLPQSWQAKSTPPLERDGDVLRGHYTGIPADCLAIATREPLGPGIRPIIFPYVGVAVLTLIVGGILSWWTGKQFAARWFTKTNGSWLSRVLGWQFLVCLTFPFLWSASLGATFMAARNSLLRYLGEQRSPFFVERMMLPFLITCLLMLSVLPYGYFLAILSFRRYKRCLGDSRNNKLLQSGSAS